MLKGWRYLQQNLWQAPLWDYVTNINIEPAIQLAYLEQHPLYGVFLDLWKAFNAMDWPSCLTIIRAYGVGPNMLRLIKTF